LKVLFGVPLRQTVGLIASLIKMAGLDWPVPDWSTLCRWQARISVQIPYRRAGGPINLLIDSTGIRFAMVTRSSDVPMVRHGAAATRTGSLTRQADLHRLIRELFRMTTLACPGGAPVKIGI